MSFITDKYVPLLTADIDDVDRVRGFIFGIDNVSCSFGVTLAYVKSEIAHVNEMITDYKVRIAQQKHYAIGAIKTYHDYEATANLVNGYADAANSYRDDIIILTRVSMVLKAVERQLQQQAAN